MTRTPWLLPVVFGLVACGPYDEERFVAEAADAECAWLVACYPQLYPSGEACVAEVEDRLSREACPIEPSAARDCVRALDDMECPEADGGFPEWPEVCAQARECPPASEE